jgi:hypothetical protein
MVSLPGELEFHRVEQRRREQPKGCQPNNADSADSLEAFVVFNL